MKAKDYIIIGGAVALFLLWRNKQKKKSTISKVSTNGTTGTSSTANSGTSQVTSFPTPTSSQPEQVFGLGLPTGMDLPVLTAGTGISTEVAIQQGGVVTEPKPAFVSPPALDTESALTLGGVSSIATPIVAQTSNTPLTNPSWNPKSVSTLELVD